jgi:hypothetical protein
VQANQYSCRLVQRCSFIQIAPCGRGSLCCRHAGSDSGRQRLHRDSGGKPACPTRAFGRRSRPPQRRPPRHISWRRVDGGRHRPPFESIGLAPSAHRRRRGGQLRWRLAGRLARRRCRRTVQGHDCALRGRPSPHRPDLGAHRRPGGRHNLPLHQAAGGRSARGIGHRVRHPAARRGRRAQCTWRFGAAARAGRLPADHTPRPWQQQDAVRRPRRHRASRARCAGRRYSSGQRHRSGRGRHRNPSRGRRYPPSLARPAAGASTYPASLPASSHGSPTFLAILAGARRSVRRHWPRRRAA